MRKMVILLTLSLFFIRCGGVEAVSGSTEDPEEVLNPSPSVIKSAAISSTLSSVNYPAFVAVDAGFAGNGTIIAIPAGFTADQCRFTAAAANIPGSAISTSVSINSTTGEVVCEKVVQEREEVPPQIEDCVAAYTVVCVATAQQALLLSSPDGTCFRVTVSDAGALQTTQATCPSSLP